MNIQRTAIDGVIVIEPKMFGDPRGYFLESYSLQRYQEAGISCTFVQDNISHSARSVLRGLHFQYPRMQDKLLHVLKGEILDVVVDVRLGSPTFSQHVAIVLDDNKHNQIFVPKGFAHGFLVLSTEATINYKCSDFYVPSEERGILWNDPGLGIDWGTKNPILSERDKIHPLLTEISHGVLPRYVV